MFALLLWLLASAYAVDPQPPVRLSGPMQISPGAYESIRAEDNRGFIDNDYDDMNLKEFLPDGSDPKPIAQGPPVPGGPPGQAGEITAQQSANRARMWFDFVRNHDANVQLPSKISSRKEPRDLENQPPPPQNAEKIPEIDLKYKYFIKNSFDLDLNDEYGKPPTNWTTCDEVKYDSQFHPEKVINIHWLAFYLWVSIPTDSTMEYRFTYVPLKTAQAYHYNYGPYLNSTIDWSKPKMLLTEKGAFQRESLLIAGDQYGLFYTIPNTDLPEYVKKNNITLPLLPIRLKMVNRYLVLMFCVESFAAMFAPAGHEPRTDAEKARVAATAGLRGRGQPVDRNMEKEYDYRQRQRLAMEADTESMYPLSEQALAEFHRRSKNKIGNEALTIAV